MKKNILIIPKDELNSQEQKVRRERRGVLIIALIILAAWVAGYFRRDTDTLEYAIQVLPGAARVEQRGSYFIGQDEAGELIGYAAAGKGDGYGGPIQVMVGVSLSGELLGLKVMEQRETPGFYCLVDSHGYLDQFLNKPITNPFLVGSDLDAISGATITTEGIASSVRESLRIIAREGLDSPLPLEKTPVKFGLPEVFLIGLYAASLLSRRLHNPKIKQGVRWGTLTISMIVLGFIYTAPLTISQVIAFLSGYWPDWHNNLYWYLLIGGMLLSTILDGRNPYCSHFCPFGAFQETLSKLTDAKLYRPKGWKDFLEWLPRVLTLGVIVIGLILRQPGVVGYEPFATLFDLRGTSLEWALLILIIFASLIFYRPFCNFICPIDPTVDYIYAIRRWISDVRKK